MRAPTPALLDSAVDQLVAQLPQAALLCDQQWKVLAQTQAFVNACNGKHWLGCALAQLIGESEISSLSAQLATGAGQASLFHIVLRAARSAYVSNDNGQTGETNVSKTSASVRASEIHLLGQRHYWVEFELESGLHDLNQTTLRSSIQQMTRAFAHEVRNPLSGLRGTAQLLQRMHPELQSYTQILLGESDRLVRLLDRLNAQYKPKLRLANAHEIAEQTRALASAQFPHIAWKRDYDPSVPELKLDPDELMRALLNLCINAGQARANQVCLRTRVEHSVQIPARVLSTALRIDVHDNGEGVPESVRDSLFLPLVTTRAGAGGSGFGLAQVFAAALDHGGYVRYRSVPGDTCFSLFLPT